MSGTKNRPTTFVALIFLFFASIAQAEVINADSKALQEMLDQSVPVVDVRYPEEWSDTGIIDSSHLLTFFDAQGNYDAEKWLSDLAAIVKSDEPVILVCRSGNRSKMVSQWLSEEQGYSHVFNVTDGIQGWKAENGKTVAP